MVGDVLERADHLALVEFGLGHRNGHGIGEQARGGGVTVVQFVAHLQRLGDDRLELQAADRVQRLAQGGRPHIPPHPQALQSLLAVITELLVAFHLPAEGAVAEGLVLHHPHRRRGEIVPAIGPTVW